ncbi:MAG: glycogen-binding domain-containing protein [Verrucomicrobiota bacterium]
MTKHIAKPKPGKAAPKPVLVRFEFVHPTAQKVCIAGTFNDWHCSVSEMVPLGEGRWGKELMLEPGTYEYRLVVDGEWTTDPNCGECAPNPFGTANSVLRVAAAS